MRFKVKNPREANRDALLSLTLAVAPFNSIKPNEAKYQHNNVFQSNPCSIQKLRGWKDITRHVVWNCLGSKSVPHHFSSYNHDQKF